MKRHIKKAISGIIALSIVLLALPMNASALNGTAEYTPAESNISGKYWVSATATDGDANLAIDGNLNTVWVAEEAPASLTVDLGGTYDAVRKIETEFASNSTVYKYIIEGSTDGQAWTTLADRSGNEKTGGIYTDIFTFEGLRYVKLTITAGAPVGVREFRIINYLREDMDNGSDSSTVSWSNSYYYNAGNNPAMDGIRGGQLTEETKNTGNNFFGLTKDMGWDTTRLRVWNEPRSEGNWQYAGDINQAIDLENWPAVNNSPTSCSPDAQRAYAEYIVGADQNLALDFHYSDSWSDPQNQPKPYAWADLEFDELVDATYDFTYEYIKSLIEQDTVPSIVAIGNEITNGMMWGSEYLEVNEFADYHDYYKTFIRDNSPENMQEDGRTIDGTKINPDAKPGGGVKWLKFEEAEGDKDSEAYQDFLDSVNNLAQLVNAGSLAIQELNEEYGLDIQTEMHFAFNLFEQPRNGDKVVSDPDFVFEKVTTLVGTLADDLDSMDGMVDRIGVSYYPDWHGTYEQLQRNIVELSKMLPDVDFNIAECSPSHSGTINDWMDNPNYPVGTRYSVQMAGDIGIEIMKTINDVPNNAGKGVWPWNGQSVYGTGSGANATLQASFKSWNDAFAKNVVESSMSIVTTPGKTPALPETVKSLDVATGVVSDVAVVWDAIDTAQYAQAGTFTVEGTAVVTVPDEGRGKEMTSVKATVVVADLYTRILEYTIDYAERVMASDELDTVIPSVVAAFEKALMEAKDALENAVTQEQVDTAAENLLNTIHYLDFKQADRTDLIKLIESAERTLGEEELYTPATYAPFMKALNAAKEVAGNEDEMDQELVDQAWDELYEALFALRYKPNKDLLNSLMQTAKSLDLSLYTANSTAVLLNSVNIADEVLADENAEEDDVTAATSKLASAIDKMELINAVAGGKKNTDTSNDDADDTANSNSSTSTAGSTKSNTGNPKTGDTALFPILALMIVCGLGVAVLKKKNR